MYSMPATSAAMRLKARDALDAGYFTTTGVLPADARRTFGSSGMTPITLVPSSFSIWAVLNSFPLLATRLMIAPSICPPTVSVRIFVFKE